MTFRIMACATPRFYGPLLCSLKLLESEGHEAAYSLFSPARRSWAMLEATSPYGERLQKGESFGRTALQGRSTNGASTGAGGARQPG